MKKSFFYLFALICAMGLFTACNDDDDEKSESTLSQVIESDLIGTYEGKLSIPVGDETITTDQNIILSTSSTENALKLELNDFSYGGIELGNIVVDPCVVTEADGTYDFQGSETLTLDLVGSCAVEVAGTISGKNIDIDIAVDVALLQQSIDVTFTGTKAD